MAMWELHDGEEQVGPHDDAHVLRMIVDGLPDDTLVRASGAEDWKSLRTHAPFALALGRRGKGGAVPVVAVAPPAQVPAAPPPARVAVDNVVTTRPETSPVTWGCAAVAGMMIFIMLVAGLGKNCGSVPTVGADGGAAQPVR